MCVIITALLILTLFCQMVVLNHPSCDSFFIFQWRITAGRWIWSLTLSGGKQTKRCLCETRLCFTAYLSICHFSSLITPVSLCFSSSLSTVKVYSFVWVELRFQSDGLYILFCLACSFAPRSSGIPVGVLRAIQAGCDLSNLRAS